MVPSMQKNMKSSTSPGFHVEPGFFARRRASHQPAVNAIRYMIPYQWTFSGPKLPKGPISKAILSNPGYWIMRGGILLSLPSNAAEKGLEVTGFGNRRMHRMI